MRISDWSSDVCSSDLRGPPYPHRGLLVAILADGAHREGAFHPGPPQDFARSRRRARKDGPRVAGGWTPVGTILERGGEGEGRVLGPLLLLEGRAAAGPGCATAARNRDRKSTRLNSSH